MKHFRLFNHYVTAIKTYLGHEVTRTLCNIDQCVDERIWGNGSHSGHVNNMADKRHDLVQNDMVKMLKRGCNDNPEAPFEIQLGLAWRRWSL